MKTKFILLFILYSIKSLAQNYVPDTTFGGDGFEVTNYNMYFDNNQAPTSVHYVNNKYVFAQKTQLSCFSYNSVPDYTYGTLGYLRIIPPNCTNCSVVIKNSKIINNNIFVFGKYLNYSTSKLYGFVAKTSFDGVFDPTFGNNGLTSFIIGDDFNNNNNSSDGITDIVYKNGNYFAVGTAVFTVISYCDTKNVFTVKMNDNGIIDLTYDVSGLKKMSSLDLHSARNIYEYQDNLLIIGSSENAENSLTLIKIDENGNFITTFGDNGVKKIPFALPGYQFGEGFSKCKLIGGELYFIKHHWAYSWWAWKKIQKANISDLSITDIANLSTYNASGNYLIDNDKIYILDCINNCQPNFNITKRNLDGTLDTTFNQTGTYSLNFPESYVGAITNDVASVFVKHSDNSIFFGGYTAINGTTTAPNAGFAMARIKDESLNNDEFNILNDFTIAPNPVKDFFTINNPQNLIIENISIRDISGKIIFNINDFGNTINIEHFNSGIYFILIKSNKGTICKKLIKK